MDQVIWSAGLEADLQEIARYVAEQDREQASEIVNATLTRAQERIEFPELGAILPEIGLPTIREVLVKETFRLIYEIRPQNIVILAFIRLSCRLGKRELHRRRQT